MVKGKLKLLPGDSWWKPALELYLEQKDDIQAGRTPRIKSDGGLTIADLCNHFLTAKLRKVESGELGQRMFMDYREATGLLVATFGKQRRVDDLIASDFEQLRATMARRWGPVRLGNAITRVKSVFSYGVNNGLMAKAPLYGSEFRKPERTVLRRHRAQVGERMLEPAQLRQLIDAANVPLKAMILLGINAGFGNVDCASLPLTALDLERGWINFPRPKTGIPRRCPLWPETVAALRVALAERPAPWSAAETELALLQRSGRRWVRDTEKSRTDNVSVLFCELLKTKGLYRPGLSFYTLRHIHRTVADEARDTVACDVIMGHSDPSMAGHYRERVEDDRLRAVVNVVREWLFGQQNPEGDSSASPCTADALPSEGAPLQSEREDRPVVRLYVG
jgi:integrase